MLGRSIVSLNMKKRKFEEKKRKVTKVTVLSSNSDLSSSRIYPAKKLYASKVDLFFFFGKHIAFLRNVLG
jgi:hypothetical protein